MMNFCTYFDSYYMLKGLGLYLSLERVTNDFHLYVMAFDKECYDKLLPLNLEHMTVELLDDFETPELLDVKPTRSKGEYCWTCGPSVIYHFLTKFNLPDITYLDSDLMFFCSPQVIFDELESKNASIGLSPHFIPYNATGKYCVQYCYFKNDKDGLGALTWWKNECLKWCYSQIEEGKYGDQLYLDQMPRLFDNVVDIDNRGAGLAYWNSFAYRYTPEGIVYKGRTYPFIFYHYSGFNISWVEKKVIVKECYKVTEAMRKIMIQPYVTLLSEVCSKYLGQPVEGIDYQFSYSKINCIISYIMHFLEKFDCWHRIKGYLLTKKYTKRKSPYSEK